MLYVTSRSKNDAFTAHRTMYLDRGPDGGMFLPMRMPVFSPEQVTNLGRNSFGQNVADILNLFFSAGLTSWDVDMAIGRYPTALHSMNHRILISEWWHNQENSFHATVDSLAARVRQDIACEPATDWLSMAAYIAMLFGVFGDLIQKGQIDTDIPVDIVVTSGTFTAPMAAWYARAMGLPVGNVICGCNDNGAPWDLFNRGMVDTDALTIHTTTPEADLPLPPDLERLICCTLGHEEAMRFSWACAEGRTYTLPEEQLDELKKGMFAAVVSQVRVETIIPSVYRTNCYILDPYAALAYGALADYRVRTGSGGLALLIVEKSPACSASVVANAMHISKDALLKRLEEM